jgi:hypothetical protein
MKWFEKSAPPKIAPTIGMMMSPVSEVTMAPNAAPMITATARSITLPLAMNALKSWNMATNPSRCDPNATTCHQASVVTRARPAGYS